jgi:uncharacterized phage-associated protein
MRGPYSPKRIANAFLEKSLQVRRPIFHMNLQRLIYAAHGYYLAGTEKSYGTPVPLINEFFQAWSQGPICPSIYSEFKDFETTPITMPALEYDPDYATFAIAPPPPKEDDIANNACEYVWATYSDDGSASLLNDLARKAGGAWDRAGKEAGGLKGKDIPNTYVLEDFRPFAVTDGSPAESSLHETGVG